MHGLGPPSEPGEPLGSPEEQLSSTQQVFPLGDDRVSGARWLLKADIDCNPPATRLKGRGPPGWSLWQSTRRTQWTNPTRPARSMGSANGKSDVQRVDSVRERPVRGQPRPQELELPLSEQLREAGGAE